MKEKLHRLIDAIFGDESNEVQPVSKPHKPVKVFWRKPICKNNPLEQPKGERPILGRMRCLSSEAILVESMMEEPHSLLFSTLVRL